jgi:hypothetical protein
MPYQPARPDGPTMTPTEMEEWERKLKDGSLFPTIAKRPAANGKYCACRHQSSLHAFVGKLRAHRGLCHAEGCLCGGFLEVRHDD